METKKQEVLKDIGKNGKDRKWKERKLQSLSLGEAFGGVFVEEMKLCGYAEDEAKEIMFDKMFAQTKWMRKNEKTNKCAEYLEFKKTHGGQLKLYKAWFCKDRMCPMCSWRRAMKLSLQVAQILEEVKKREIKGRPIFATFSLPNVKGEDIGKSFSEYAEGFNRLMKYKEIKKYCLGAIRASEITYNENLDTYNTHIHCILWMNTGYFRNGYLSQKRWRELWTKATKMQHHKDPLQVNIKAIKPREKTERDPTGLFSAVLEVSKYPVKPEAFVKFTTVPENENEEDKSHRLQCVKYLSDGMHRKRLISFFGIFKEIRKELQLDDVEDGDLVGCGEDDIDQESESVIYVWNSDGKNYFKELFQRIN